MANISQIELHGTVYEVKDTTARTDLSIQSDWNVDDSESKAYIKNKPTLGTASALDVSESGNASTTQVVRGDDTRLSDARNASDVSAWAKEPNKPEYTASEVGAIAATARGTANGVAELDATGKVPSSQLPSYVDEVLEYDAKASFPATGETGKIYVDKTTNLTWRWGGSEYVEISPSLALGETPSTAYAGDKGKANADAINGIQKLIPSSATESNKLVTAADIPTVPSISGKADKVDAATSGNFAGLDATGNLTDSKKKASDFATSEQGNKADTAYTHATDSNRLTSAKDEGLYKVATTTEGHIKSATPVSKLDIIALGIPAQDTTYSAATETTDGLMTANDKKRLNGIPTLGTAATKNVPSSGNAGASEVVLGNDSRLSDARTPTSHSQASNTINVMTGYSKPSLTSGIVETDTLNAAIGKLEKALDDKQPSGNYAPLSHTHTKSQITDFPTLGTAATKDVASSGNASSTQVVMGNDTRLTDARNAADVYDWAKQENKPAYTASEVGAAKLVHYHGMSDITDLPSPIGTAATKDYTQSVTEGSEDLVTSGAVYRNLEVKQNLLVITTDRDLHYAVPVGYIFMWNGSEDTAYNLKVGHWYKKTSSSVQGDTFEEVEPVANVLKQAYRDMPTASSDNYGQVIQYVYNPSESIGDFKHGEFYTCDVSSYTEEGAIYDWVSLYSSSVAENDTRPVRSSAVYNAIQNVANGSKIITVKQGSLDYLTIPANQTSVTFNYSYSGLHDTDYTIIQRFDKENNVMDFGNLMITPTLPFTADSSVSYDCNYLILLDGTTKKEDVHISRTGNVGMLSVDTASTSDITFRVFGIKL